MLTLTRMALKCQKNATIDSDGIKMLEKCQRSQLWHSKCPKYATLAEKCWHNVSIMTPHFQREIGVRC